MENPAAQSILLVEDDAALSRGIRLALEGSPAKRGGTPAGERKLKALPTIQKSPAPFDTGLFLQGMGFVYMDPLETMRNGVCFAMARILCYTKVT